MKQAELKALRSSVRKWLRICEGKKADTGWPDCALCRLHRHDAGVCAKCVAYPNDGEIPILHGLSIKCCFGMYSEWSRSTRWEVIGKGRKAYQGKRVKTRRAFEAALEVYSVLLSLLPASEFRKGQAVCRRHYSKRPEHLKRKGGRTR